mmetsp:Transcript_3103/g.7445  ORF Transcript_3103/g.7445 Transcript_3103/m.7445 type:complete len:854 (+) Transcript_3103:388-2949(+)
MSRPRTPGRLPPISPAPSPLDSEAGPVERAEHVAATMASMHDTTRYQLTASVQSLHDLANKLEEKVAAEIGTLRNSAQAVTKQLTKQLQESQDRYIASELVVQVRDREVAQRIKAEADLNRTIERLQFLLQREGEAKAAADSALHKERSERADEKTAQEKRHATAIKDIAKSHALAVERFEAELKQERSRTSTEVKTVTQQLESQLKDLSSRLTGSKTELDEVRKRHVALAEQHKVVQTELTAHLKKSSDAAKAHAHEMASLKEEFASKTQELTLTLAAEHGKVERDLKAHAAAAATRADTRHAELLLEHQACKQKLTETEEVNVQLQTDLKAEMHKLAVTEKQHAAALHESVASAASTLDEAKAELAADKSAAIASLKSDHAHEVKALQDQIAACEAKEREDKGRHEEYMKLTRSDMAELQGKLDASEAAVKAIQDTLAEELRSHADRTKVSADATAELQHDHSRKTEELRQSLASQQSELLALLKADHAAEIARQKEDYVAQVSELGALVQTKNDELQAAEEKHKEEVTILRHEHSKEVLALKDEHTEAIREARASHEKALAAADERLSAAAVEHRTQSEKLRKEIAELGERSAATLATRERALESVHQKTVRELEVAHAEAKGTYEAQSVSYREKLQALESSHSERQKLIESNYGKQIDTLELKLRAANDDAKNVSEERQREARRWASLEQEKDEEIANLRDDLTRAAKSGTGTQAELVACQRELADAEKRLATALDDAATLQKRYSELEADKSLVDRASRLAADDVSTHISERKSERENFERTLEKQKAEYETAMKEQRAEYEAIIDRQSREYDVLYSKAEKDFTELEELQKTKAGRRRSRASAVKQSK